MQHARSASQTATAFSLSRALLAQLDAQAEDRLMNRSEMVRFALARELGYNERDSEFIARKGQIPASAQRAVEPTQGTEGAKKRPTRSGQIRFGGRPETARADGPPGRETSGRP